MKNVGGESLDNVGVGGKDVGNVGEEDLKQSNVDLGVTFEQNLVHDTGRLINFWDENLLVEIYIFCCKKPVII